MKMKPLLFLLFILVCSCEKEQLIGQDQPADHDRLVPFILGLGESKYHIEIEDWQSGFEPIGGDTLFIDAYLKDTKNVWYCVFYRRFTVHIFDDHDLKYVGWNFVQDVNYVDRQHLNPDFIDVSTH